ncbi:PH domain-containing protein [Marinicella sp. W31]|uniref:PH domain-containing protein n=1 Tax=Marinicella sp. W31 TaxID=3023713 RepID=UPI003757DC4F
MLPQNAKSLEPSYRKILLIIAAIVPLIMIGPLMPFMIFADAIPLWLRIILALALILLVAVLLALYTRRWYQHYHYWLQSEGLHISKGVFWRSVTLIPKNRVQHIDIASGPLDRRYDLAKLIVHTAGTRNASVSLPGLLQADAVSLRQQLLDLQDDDIV